jgi:tRNA pseudouridine38-40 synthase
MERNIKLVIAYDGTDFHGWQVQPGMRTVQEELQAIVGRVVCHPAAVVGASRTDAGVHARGQVAHLLTSCVLPVENLRRAIQNRLPADIALVHAAEVAADFHATRDARSKLYRYGLYHAAEHRVPVQDMATRYCWHVWYPLDLDRMRAAAAVLVGRHDFAGFMNLGSPRESTWRTILRIEIQRRWPYLLIDVEGDGFLYNQVRVMVGTLIEVGRGHWSPERVAEVLATGDRSRAGPTAPALGLSLRWVRYGPQRRVADGA